MKNLSSYDRIDHLSGKPWTLSHVYIWIVPPLALQNEFNLDDYPFQHVKTHLMLIENKEEDILTC